MNNPDQVGQNLTKTPMPPTPPQPPSKEATLRPPTRLPAYAEAGQGAEPPPCTATEHEASMTVTVKELRPTSASLPKGRRRQQ